MGHLSQNVNLYVYETGSTFGKSAPLGQAPMRQGVDRDRAEASNADPPH
jgi:hypothetical protein